MAIMCSPYVEESYDFERDAVMHFMSILTVFLLLFIAARFAESAVLERVFRPLSMMSLTMSRAGGGKLEHISYGRTDEISVLVDAYNRMVDELSESTQRLAQAERDKAWSDMARQVAHEIKNPLTPMKLQIQRLIRLKAKGDPSWQDKFDDVSKVLLDHIDILTETSNEFSTFAKRYAEEHTDINRDALLQQEISMFDNREDVQFSYMGLEGATIKGPRPQLTRVFVNLLGNAVQAVEGRGGAKVLVSLRKSVREGCYDIVVEDNGPGVSEENIDKLFTPNFTTKNGGSGLGLAISRSILESCGATISYSRSFTLQGACFTICYPSKTE
jgi:nitrogen fixation/metabolism regulation signal transduction histidine kinase